MLRLMAVTLLILLPAAPAAAHPHVFVDTGVEVIFDDQGRATAIRMTWTYDEYTSLLVVQDRGFDEDADGEATAAEKAALSGFDMDWEPGFPGDTYVLAGEVAVALDRPRDWTADYAEGKLTSTHLRAFAAPVTVGETPLVVQAYDPGFYTAYAITGVPLVTGRSGCTAQIFAPEPGVGDEALRAALAELTPDMDAEAEYPAVGAAFADEVRVTCGNPG